MLAGLLTQPVEARRGGSFGSRGSRTYVAPRSGYGTSRYVPPIERSMTLRSMAPDRSVFRSGTGAQPYGPQRSRFGGLGGGLLGGLVAGGLIGHFLGGGSGWGGGSAGGGFLLSLIQIALFGGIAWLVIGFFWRRRTALQSTIQQGYTNPLPFTPSVGSRPWDAQQQSQYPVETADIALTPADQNTFEQLLIEVQDAFGREDYRRLRGLTTREIMSFLAEELGENATHNRRNEVSATRLIDAEVLEAWQEEKADFATIRLRYESIDVMRDRTTGTIIGGMANAPTEANEVWTFVREESDIWKLFAIQEA